MHALAEIAGAQFRAYEAKKESAVGLTGQARDQIIYEWVTFEGKSQVQVASLLDVSQGTVSRALARFERRLAHAKPREGGRLDHEEQLRVQRWLTYERNERILASCLRIAGEVEGFVDTTKSTYHREGIADMGTEIRTETARLDRSGTAARFLRLAFRINMEQLKLVELEPLAPLPPLSADELAELADEVDVEDGDKPQTNEPAVKLAELDAEEESVSSDPREGKALVDEAREGEAPAEPGAAEQEGGRVARANYAHSAHKRIDVESGASADEPSGCDANGEREKKMGEGRMGDRWRTSAPL
ncbi:MAG: hypothetical protein L0211_10435 [Planctomycetaceae bacterium]|nr:hypothetical protein [Planctomycetaceae bacterium]